MVAKVGTYKGRREEDPGKMKFRQKGFFKNENKARAAQDILRKQGLKTRVIKYTTGWGLDVMAKHDFWVNNYWVDRDIR
jgi:hypothetical protein